MMTTSPFEPKVSPEILSSTPVALSFTHVSMVFPDGTEALRDISLTVREGEFISIVGPSGCGKSTLLKIASGLIAHSSGTVEVNREKLGYTFQDATLLPWRTVRKNVEVLMELRGVPQAERARIAQEQIDLMGLAGFEAHYPKRLSGGMKMRVSLARSLALKPSVFMFDEPFAALDEITRERLNDEVIKLFVKERFAGLFITHSIAEALYMSSRVLVMSARPGRLIADYAVPFGYPRQPDMRYTPEFARLSGEISRTLRGALEA